MDSTQQLHERGQSIWLDNITRTLLISGTLAPRAKGWCRVIAGMHRASLRIRGGPGSQAL
jgi:hypothetical protein